MKVVGFEKIVIDFENEEVLIIAKMFFIEGTIVE